MNYRRYGYNYDKRMSFLRKSKKSRYSVSELKRGKRRLKPYRRTKTARGQYSKTKGLRKQVAQLSRIAKADQGTLVYRQRTTLKVTCAVQGSVFLQGANLNSSANMEIVIAELRYYNPLAPATLITADGALGSFSKDFLFDKSHHRCVMRNNYQIPVHVRGYIFGVREDTNLTPVTVFISGLADVGNPSVTSSLVYPTDSRTLNEIWKILKSCNVILQPGQRKILSLTHPKFMYDPSITDTHALSFQRSFHGSNFSCRVEGVIGHDNAVTTEQGTLQGGVDIQIDSTWNILYPAGSDIKTIIVSDLGSTFTNGGVVCNKPLADNQTFSIA